MKKNRVIVLMCLLLGLCFLMPQKSEASSNVIGTQGHVTIWARYKDLQYGFSYGKNTNEVIPNVQYADDNNSEGIDHIYGNADGTYPTTSGFTLFTEDTINLFSKKLNENRGFQDSENTVITSFDPETIESQELANGTRLIKATSETDDYQLTCSMWPDTSNGYINTVYTLKNKSSNTQTYYPAKGVDTMLNRIDSVPMYSLGQGKGLYMKTESSNGIYQMEYTMEVEAPPGMEGTEIKTPYYAGSILKYGFGHKEVFKSRLRPSEAQMNKYKGETLVDKSNESDSHEKDTAIYLYWGEKELKSQESFYGGYTVGVLDLGKITVDNTMENLTSSDVNYAKDSIVYTSNVAFPSTSAFKDVNYEYQLPIDVETPTKITVDGKVQNVSKLYDESTHKIIISLGNKNAKTKSVIKIWTQLSDSSSGKDLSSNAKVSGLNSYNKKKESEADCTFKVEKTVNVTSKYVDEFQNEIADSKMEKVDNNTSTTITGKTIPGYEITKVQVDETDTTLIDGNSVKIEVGTANKDVVFTYKSIHFSPVLEVDKSEIPKTGTLNYKLSITSGMKYEDGQATNEYNNFKVTIPIDSNLEEIENVVVALSDGTKVGMGQVDADGKTITATLTSNVKDTENLVVTYSAKVKASSKTGDYVKQQATVQSEFDANGAKAITTESNEVSTKIADKPVIKILFKDKEGKNELTEYAMSLEAAYGDVNLKDNQDVINQIKTVEFAGYNVEPPKNEAKVSVDAPEVTVIYTVEGKVYVKSVPTEIQFEKITYDATIKRLEIIDYRERLIVRDTRFNKASGWILSAKVSVPMTNQSDGVTLDSSLRYVDSNKEEKILSDENTNIVNNQKQESEYDVTNDWNDNNGLKLVVDPKLTTVTKGDYEGEITWEVTSAP